MKSRRSTSHLRQMQRAYSLLHLMLNKQSRMQPLARSESGSHEQRKISELIGSLRSTNTTRRLHRRQRRRFGTDAGSRLALLSVLLWWLAMLLWLAWSGLSGAGQIVGSK